MRKLIAAILAAVLSTLCVSDPLLCPDGCTAPGTQSQHAQDSAPVDGCWICHLAVSVPPLELAAPSTIAVVKLELLTRLLLPARTPLDHPPRVA